MNNQCDDCLHKNVCAYRKHYEDAESLYKKIKDECKQYPWFVVRIECTQYFHDYLHNHKE